MKIKPLVLDKLILTLLCFTVLADMLNGFFLNNGLDPEISQIYKGGILALFLLRLFPYKIFYFIIAAFGILQLSPLCGLIKTGSFSAYIQDVIYAIKWLYIPLSFFYFKILFQSSYIDKLISYLKRIIIFSLGLILINQALGVLGFGEAFYNTGYGNATGTKGFIYAGNELSILVLALGFIISCYYKQQGKHLKNVLFLGLFLCIALTMTSKTGLAGTLAVFLIPYLSAISTPFKKKWVKYLALLASVGLPLFLLGFIYGIKKSGLLNYLEYSVRINDQDLLTVLLSNRNNFVISGWHYFTHHLSTVEMFFANGLNYYVSTAGHDAEIDFISLLFSSGVIGLCLFLFILFYWISNAYYLKKLNRNLFPFSKAVLIYIIFTCFVANLAGHVFTSGIAGFYIALGFALMFYKQKKASNNSLTSNNSLPI